MTIPTPATPQGTIDNATAVARGQHHELRRLVRAVSALAGAAARGDEACRQELPQVIDLVLGKLYSHFAFEDAALAPLLDRASSAGHEQRLRLRAQHDRQRRELGRLLERARVGSESAALATDLERFVADLTGELAGEEHWLAGAGARREIP